MSYSLDTDSFLNALSSMISRRERPSYVVSDNGTNFKSAKRALRTVIGNADINDEELHTAICGAKKLLNSRLVTFVSSNVNDLVPLTPNHFLVGSLGDDFAPKISEDEAKNPTKRWRRVQQLLAQFWQRWRREFLPSLNARGK